MKCLKTKEARFRKKKREDDLEKEGERKGEKRNDGGIEMLLVR